MKIINRVIAASAIMLALAACSGNNENNGDKEPDTDATDALHEDDNADDHEHSDTASHNHDSTIAY